MSHSPPLQARTGAQTRIFVIKTAVDDLNPPMLKCVAQKTMYHGKHIAAGDEIFVFSSENEGGQGLIWSGIVTAAAPVPVAPTSRRQTPRVDVSIRRTAVARRPLGRRELKSFNDWSDESPQTELNFKLYHQATNKIVAVSERTAAFLRSFF